MCTGDNELSSLFKKYRLCKEMLNSEDIGLLNNMKPAEALNMTHALHKQLRFEGQSIGGAWSITPWAAEDDVYDVCNTINDAAAASYCDQIRRSFECTGPCIEMAILPSAEDIKVIVPGLNKLYGIQCTGSHWSPCT